MEPSLVDVWCHINCVGLKMFMIRIVQALVHVFQVEFKYNASKFLFKKKNI